MERWNIFDDAGRFYIHESPDGKWVKYDDVMTMDQTIGLLLDSNKKLRQELSELKFQLDAANKSK